MGIFGNNDENKPAADEQPNTGNFTAQPENSTDAAQPVEKDLEIDESEPKPDEAQPEAPVEVPVAEPVSEDESEEAKFSRELAEAKIQYEGKDIVGLAPAKQARGHVHVLLADRSTALVPVEFLSAKLGREINI